MVSYLEGNEVAYVRDNPHGQVYRATHIFPTSPDTASWERQKYMYRSFISFSFGGKWIEDYGLIAVVDGDRMQRSGSASFEDLTSTYEVIDGQFYWGTHYEANQINFNLATDGITQNQLDEFLHWFAGGYTRELILAEHPNRAIMARVAAAPTISVIPFEEKTDVLINDKIYKTSTTMYKGNINLSFIMDEPYWYSKVNLFGYNTETDGWVDIWTDATGEEVSIIEDKDALKIIKEDGIPTYDMIQIPLLLGNDLTINPDFSITGDTSTGPQTLNNPILYNGVAVAGASENENIETAIGYVGTHLTDTSTPTMMDNDSKKYLYYPGTAPCCPQISFTLTPGVDISITENTVEGSCYITSPRNSFVQDSDAYDTLSITSIHENNLYFTAPSAYIGYNQAIKIFTDNANKSLTEIRKMIRDGVNHKAARAWAIAVLDSLGENFILNDALSKMVQFIRDNNEYLASTISIDCKTGRAVGVIGYKVISNETVINTSTDFSSLGTINGVEEDVGDMICSNYIKLEDKNYPNIRGQIVGRNDIRVSRDDIIGKYRYMTEEEYNTYIKGYSYEITHNNQSGLKNFSIDYKYMYY